MDPTCTGRQSCSGIAPVEGTLEGCTPVVTPALEVGALEEPVGFVGAEGIVGASSSGSSGPLTSILGRVSAIGSSEASPL